jgi:tRNA 2-thiocytidine biosynthesis protein TtcA
VSSIAAASRRVRCGAPPTDLTAVERRELEKLERKLGGQLGATIRDYQLIGAGDRVMVAISGGKDSYALLTLLERFRCRVRFDFSIVGVHLDQVQPGYDGRPLANWLDGAGFTYKILRQDTYSVVVDKIAEGSTYCSLCSRLRRGALYAAAADMGCSTIALGHHRDDANETLLLNVFYAGQLKSMPVKLNADDGRNTVIRPLMGCAEAAIARYAELMRFPILPCNLCGSQEGLKRVRIKQLLEVLSAENEKVPGNIAAALGNVRPSHLHDLDVAQVWAARPASVRPWPAVPAAGA